MRDVGIAPIESVIVLRLNCDGRGRMVRQT